MKSFFIHWFRNYLLLPASIFVMVIGPAPSQANNVVISNLYVAGLNSGSDYTYVQFDISWDNSWRTSTQESNWDAVWIFVKYKLSSGDAWSHATLNYVNGTSDGHTAPTNSTIKTPSDGKGVFIYRSSDMAQGSVSYTNVQLRWNYGVDGVADNAVVDVAVFGIEMVYVPQGSFYLGDGTTSNIEGHFNDYNSSSPFQVTGEGELTLGGSTAGNLRNNDASGMPTGAGWYPDDFNNTTTKTLPAAFPKGYNAFYCMKYELMQEQYTHFLNKLTRTQQNNRVGADVSTDAITNRYAMSNTAAISYRNTVICPASGNGTTAPIVFSTTTPYRACNFINNADQAAYADWAGLRFMTEMEYEKACRGTLSAVVGEFAWGSTSYTVATGYSNDSTSTETPSNSTANYIGTNNAGVQGPMRVGCFTGGSRLASGGTYYGIMEMTGSMWEQTVGVGRTAGRAYTGSHGDGVLSTNGNATNSDWVGYSAGEVTSADDGIATRGGGYSTTGTNYSTVSGRAQIGAGIRYRNAGVRYVRTAP